MAIQIRRGTDSQWESNKSNIVAGEPAITTDTGRLFVGTGTGTYEEYVNKSTLADYVVEQGTSGIWTYRKWASGIAECWGNSTYTVNITSPWGSLYEAKLTDSINYPTGLFTNIPSLSVTHTNMAAMVEISGTGTASHTGTLYAVRPNTLSSALITVNLHAKGTWK